jgi:hypothetical protein
MFQLLLGCMKSNNTRYRSEINPELHGKSSIQQEKNPPPQELRLKFKKTSKLPHLELIRVQYWSSDISESRSEIPGRY